MVQQVFLEKAGLHLLIVNFPHSKNGWLSYFKRNFLIILIFGLPFPRRSFIISLPFQFSYCPYFFALNNKILGWCKRLNILFFTYKNEYTAKIKDFMLFGSHVLLFLEARAGYLLFQILMLCRLTRGFQKRNLNVLVLLFLYFTNPDNRRSIVNDLLSHPYILHLLQVV